MPGRIEVVCGCMYAGKTTELVRRMVKANNAIAFKPTLDARYHESKLATHDGLTQDAIPVPATVHGMDRILQESKGYAVVGIDECQFFSDSIVTVVDALANRGTRVICAGLDLDYRGYPFGPMPSLIAIADDVKKLTAKCSCGARANRTFKTTLGSELVEVGSHGLYEAKCRSCWGRNNGAF